MSSTRPSNSVIGLGNILLADDGFGPLVVELFRCRYDCSPEVEVLDLGTPGLDLGPYLYDRRLVVIVDALNNDGEPGTLRTYDSAEFVTQQWRLHLTGHDPGFSESLLQLQLAGHAPNEIIVVGAIPKSCELGKSMSRAVLNATSAAVDQIADLLVTRGIHCSRQKTTTEPNLWWAAGCTANLQAQSR